MCDYVPAACSTALVPDRVVQALNRKLEDIVGGQPQHLYRTNASSNMENGNKLFEGVFGTSPLKILRTYILFSNVLFAEL